MARNRGAETWIIIGAIVLVLSIFMMICYAQYPGVFKIFFWMVAAIALAGSVAAIIVASLSFAGKITYFEQIINEPTPQQQPQ